MAFYEYIQNSFTAGELSPRLTARSDIDKFGMGLSKMENFIPFVQGGATRRPGTEYLNEVKDSSLDTVLIPFTVSRTTSYQLEFGHNYIRFYKGKSRVGAPFEITTTYTSLQVRDIQYAQVNDILYLVHPDHPPRELRRVGTGDEDWSLVDTSFKEGPFLRIDTTESKHVISNVSSQVTLKSSSAIGFNGISPGQYVTFDWEGITYIGSIVSATGDTATVEPLWNVVDVKKLEAEIHPFVVNGPELVASVQIFDKSLVGSWIKAKNGKWYFIDEYLGPTQVTAANYPGVKGSTSADDIELDIVSYSTFKNIVRPDGTVQVSDIKETVTLKSTESMGWLSSRDEGRKIFLHLGDNRVSGEISSVVNTKEIKFEASRPIPLDKNNQKQIENNGQVESLQLGAFYDGNYPTSVALVEQRLIYAGTSDNPTTFWMSEVGIYDSFLPANENGEVLDTSAIIYDLGGRLNNNILFVSANKNVIVHTIGSEFAVRRADTGGALSPSNIIVEEQTSYGTLAGVRPTLVQNALFFVQASGHLVIEYSFSFETGSTGGYAGEQASVMSEHIIRDGGEAIDIAWQQTPFSILWFVRDDGQLVSLSYNKKQQVYAWSRHLIGGSDVKVKSLSVTPSTDGRSDWLYMIVERTIDGVTKQYVEVLTDEVVTEDLSDYYFVDSGMEITGVASTLAASTQTVAHLAGERVAIVVDGNVIWDGYDEDGPTVSEAGELDLSDISDYGSTEVTVLIGLPYRSKAQTMPIEAGRETGTAQGKNKRIHSITARVEKSVSMSVGFSEDDTTEYFFSSTDSLTEPPNIVTQDYDIDVDLPYDTRSQFWFMQEKPYPLTVLGIITELKSY